MSKKDPNYIVKVEKAIAKKYGEETIQHPKSQWTDEKERQYLEEMRQLHATDTKQEEDKIHVNGIFVAKKLIKKSTKRSCPVCNIYSFKSKDDVYMSKFDCCFKCYIQWIENREERWLNGWRPNSEQQTK